MKVRARPSTPQICLLLQNLFCYNRIPLNRIWLKIFSILPSFFNVLGLFQTFWVKLVNNWSIFPIFVKICKFWPIFICVFSNLSGNPFENLLAFLLEILFYSKFCLFNRQIHGVDGRALNAFLPCSPLFVPQISGTLFWLEIEKVSVKHCPLLTKLDAPVADVSWKTLLEKRCTIWMPESRR